MFLVEYYWKNSTKKSIMELVAGLVTLFVLVYTCADIFQSHVYRKSVSIYFPTNFTNKILLTKENEKEKRTETEV